MLQAHTFLSARFAVALLALAVALPGCSEKKPSVALFDDAAFYGKQKSAVAELAGGPRKVAPPMSLTCSDGTGLRLTQLDARAVIEGPLAFTELQLEFHNPESRQREGRFAITLPPGAAISRFAMHTGGRWMEGEVVEKQQARRIYEDYLHRKQDPALLETDAGNTFRARVFPIPANGVKKLIVSYATELANADTPYVLPLAGLGKLDELHAVVAVQHMAKGDEARDPRVVRVEQRGFEPLSDLVVHPQAAGGHSALRNGDLVAARLTLPSNHGKQTFGRTLILVDTSASEAVDFKGRVKRLGELVAFVGANGATRVKVIAFDQVSEEIFDDAPANWGKDHSGRLLARGALGASDWGAGLKVAAKVLGDAKDVRLLIFGNGVATAGDKEVDKLRAAALALKSAGVIRIDTIEMAAQRDMDVLRAIATAGLQHEGLHVQLAGGETKADFSDLVAATFAPIRVAVKGAKWVWPQELKGLRGGDGVVVYAEQDGDSIEVELSGGVDRQMTIKPARAARSLLHSAWIGARIRRLLYDGEFGDPDMRPMATQRALKLSIEHRVLCDLTALLVLESEAEYRRYNIDQTALSQILSVTGDLEVAALDRSAVYQGKNMQIAGDEPGEEMGWFDRLKAKFGGSTTGKYLRKAEQEEHVSEVYEVMVEEKQEEPPEPEAVAAAAPQAMEAPGAPKAERRRPKAEPVPQARPQSRGAIRTPRNEGGLPVK